MYKSIAYSVGSPKIFSSILFLFFLLKDAKNFQERTNLSCVNSRWWTNVVVKEQRLWRSSRGSLVMHNNDNEENTSNSITLRNPLVQH